VVAVAHPHRQLALKAAEKTCGLTYGQEGRTVLAGMTGVNLSAHVVGDELHAVADAQHRHAGAKGVGVDLGSPGLIDA
jgi:hypothetical protein